MALQMIKQKSFAERSFAGSSGHLKCKTRSFFQEAAAYRLYLRGKKFPRTRSPTNERPDERIPKGVCAGGENSTNVHSSKSPCELFVKVRGNPFVRARYQ